MKFVDLASEAKKYEAVIDARFEKIRKSGRFLFGEQMEELENRFPKLVGRKHGVAVKNCTDAIMLCLKRIYRGNMPIILPNFGAYPTAVACRNVTNKLYYVDVDASMTIDPMLEKVFLLL
jgi:dTDP-4-amino-4,6-dideoxygalactose transaminase